MGQLRRLAAFLAVLALFVAGVPPTASAAAHATAAAAVSGTQGHSDYSWWDPRGWFSSDTKRPNPQPSTFDWKAPKGRATPHVHVDPHAHRVAELTGRRTANASFYRLSDGRVQEVVSTGPVHYRDGKGHWQPIDTSVAKLSHGGFRLGNESNTFRSYFSSSPSSLVRLEQGSAFLQVGADGAHTTGPKVSGDTVTYPSALPGADLAYQVGPGGLKERIVLAKAPPAGTRPAYSFMLKVGGFTPKQRPDGSIAFYGSESKQAVFVIPAPYMSDSRADANSPYGVAYSTKVSQRMTWDAKSGTVHLMVKPDAAWLGSSARHFPVVIDPTILVAPTPSQAANVMILQDSL